MKRLAWGVVTAMLLCAMAFATTPGVNYDSVRRELGMQVVGKSEITNGVSLSLQFQEPSWETVTAAETGSNSDLLVAEYPFAGFITEEGYPLVPSIGGLFRLQPQGGVRVEVSNVQYELIEDVDYAYFIDDDIFDQLDDLGTSSELVDAWYPEQIVNVGEPALFHDFRVASIQTFPVQVNPALRQVRVVTNMDMQIVYDGEDDRNTMNHWPTKISEAFLPAYRLFLDWDESELDQYELYRAHVQVVMVDNAVLRNAMADWFEWKAQKGWEFDFLTDSDITNFTASGIRNELITRYANADPKFDYICIIGDNTGSFIVPAGSGQGDQAYSELYGNDQLADVGVGRISVENSSQAAIYANKVLTYERDPDMTNTDWYNRAMLRVSDNHAGNSKIMLLRYMRLGLMEHGYTTIDTSWRIQDNNAFAIGRINNGVSFYGARGYAGTGLSTGDISALTNTNETPVVIDVTCGTGSWAGGLGINEAYMRAGSTTAPKGGVCAFGMATYSTNPKFNNIASGGAAWALLQLNMKALGDMTLMGKVTLYNNFNGLENAGMSDFLEWFNLMGDPLIWPWLGIPWDMDVTADANVDLGVNSYEVFVNENGVPIEGAWVTLYKVDSDDDIIARGVSDADGYCLLETPITTAGDAMLTVTAKQRVPFRQTVHYVAADSRIGYTTVSYVDDGTEGTNGNGNGIPEAGETVGINFTGKNFGSNNLTNIELTAASDDIWVDDVTGTVDWTSLDAGAQAEGTGLILVDIADVCQHEWNIPLELTFTAGANSWTDNFFLPVVSAKYAFVSLEIDGGSIDPGETCDIEFDIANVGGVNSSGITALLLTADPFLGIVNANGTFPSLNIGNTATSSVFQISAHAETFPGHIAKARLVITNSNDQVDTVSVVFPIGSAATTDPTGPDHYGYFAFDNTDAGYELTPDFDWVEIAPLAPNTEYTGTTTGISETAENDDEAVTIDLPADFQIQYYGETFDQITIAGNGYLAMGEQADIALARNRTIPSPLGPNYMIAPYWEELYTTGGQIVYYYDEANGRFIVEWYNVRHGSSAANTFSFQVIFYDQVVHPTYTGDFDILFQYNDVNSSGTQAIGLDVPWWTTGIENGTQSDGIQLWYYNMGSPGAATITQGRAVLFTTNVALITGTVEGDVTEVSSGDPIEGCTVRTGNYVYSTVTDEFGHYVLDDVVIGDHDIVMEKFGYNALTTPNVLVLEDETTNVDGALTAPEFSSNVTSIDVELIQGEYSDNTITITNNGNGPLTYTAELDFQGPDTFYNNGENGPVNPNGGTDELDDPWDVIFNFELDASVETRNRGITFDYASDCFWVSGSNNSAAVGPNKMHKYSPEGEYIATYNQPVENRSAVGFYGLTSDGEYIYAVDNSVLYTMMFDAGNEQMVAIDSVEVPVSTARYIAYDADYDFFWMGDGTTDIYAVDANGNIQLQYEQDVFPRGAGYLTAEDEDQRLYLVCRRPGQAQNLIYKMNTMTGDMQEVFTFQSQNAAEMPGGSDITYYWNPLVYSLVTMLDGGEQDRIQMWELTNNDAWITIDPTEGMIAAGSSDDINVHLDASLPPGDYTVYVKIEHNAEGAVLWVPVEMIVNTGIAEEDNNSRPVDWAFNGVYPNPFNPVTNISFSLQEATRVNAVVYNLLGQRVAVLANQEMVAGHHNLLFEGLDLSSGVYFLKFNAGPINRTEKLLLMK